MSPRELFESIRSIVASVKTIHERLVAIEDEIIQIKIIVQPQPTKKPRQKKIE